MEPDQIVHGEQGTVLVYKRPFLAQAVDLVQGLEQAASDCAAGRVISGPDLWHLIEWEEDELDEVQQ
jgi:hypothetical protein